METPLVNVGILTEKAVDFVFNEEYVHTESGNAFIGEQKASCLNDRIVFNGKLYDGLSFEPSSRTASFDLKEVAIGIDFHWQRKEDQRFRGTLNIVARGDKIIAINRVDVEEYLTSVISSEMSATASTEFLKAHAVISRSWLLSRIYTTEHLSDRQTACRTDDELVRWYDHEDHDMFDVCADDHCQRYQGITRASTQLVAEATGLTRGEILVNNGAICDTRFSKCCGGITERFENVWEPTLHSYLTALRDSPDTNLPDLTTEAEAARWICSSPESFCNTNDKGILSQVLNNYDRETTDFFRWKVWYPQEQLSRLICRKSGIDFGGIIDLIPLRRGSSGRIEKLKILGTRFTYTIGKELEIRRTLSESHLYSSAFVVEKEADEGGLPKSFTLTGAGWGHGVGLCQIGAAVMGARGYGYRQILAHYYPGAEIEKKY
ncbi:MAG: SpoIID/LytB domain-containing protein [Tannerellaceae bacterium]|jgi:SpoIID/LytB domain protein|nr:SpoIID/LytB domain-containing protein [Tannerellaceae bacterium]